MKTHVLPKSCLLSKPYQYNKVYTTGKRLQGKNFNLIFIYNDLPEDRLGISISGVRLAVRRNRLKRIIKEFYRHNRSFPSISAAHGEANRKVDMVLASRKDFSPSSVEELGKILSLYYVMPQTRNHQPKKLNCLIF